MCSSLIAPVLLAGLTEVDEQKVALGCRFAPDLFTIILQNCSIAGQGSVLSDLELVDLG